MLKNYTTRVSATRSISQIETLLSGRGATDILKQYDRDRRCCSICFIIESDGKPLTFKLPAKIDACERVLIETLGPKARTSQLSIDKKVEQAERVAWRIALNWLENQMAMIDLEQAEVAEIFFPYLYDPLTKLTLYEHAKSGPNGIAGLLPAPPSI